MHHIVEVDLGGRKITLETGKMAKQAGGAVVVRSGDAVVLVTACMADQPKVGAGFFPLTVDYREYTYSAGKIPGGFIKSEGRPSEKEGIVMVEAGAQEVSEAEVLGAIEFGHECCKKIAAGIRELMKLAGKKKREFIPHVLDQAINDQVAKDARADLTEAMDTAKHEKLESYALIAALKKRVVEALPEEQREEGARCYSVLKGRVSRDEMLKHHRRPVGRAFDEVRKITIETGVLPRTHGSALFTRGETQALVTVTLGTKDDAQRIELLEPGEASKRFMLHYNFPPFSVGETGFMRGPGRREIGHGALAERSLTALIPGEDKFPYTMRVVSDILESNGSSSQATVCGASLALMDAGAPLPAHVGGIAMGLVLEGKDYAILTDIAGAEDHYGDMDFKVAGTRSGITGLQMDIKVPNITVDIMKEALVQARKGRLHILDKMYEALPAARAAIRGIIEQTGVKIDVEDDGTIHVASADEASANKAIQIISDLTATAEIGKTYLGKVVRLVDFGAFVEIFPGTDGLLHISEIAENRIKDVRDELKEGDQILVKCLALEGNKIKLSRRAVLKEQREKLKSAPVKE